MEIGGQCVVEVGAVAMWLSGGCGRRSVEGEGGWRGRDLWSAGREAQLGRKKGDRQRGGQKGTETGRSWRCWNRRRSRGPRKWAERGVERPWGQAGMRVVVDEPGKSWVVENCDGGVGPGRRGEWGKSGGKRGSVVQTEKGRLRRWVARTGSCAWGQGGVVDMAGVHCSFFIFVWVSLFVALIFFRSAPSPLRLHRRSSLLSTSLFSRRFVFFVRSCVSAFRYLSSYLSSSASLIPVRPLLSPCVSLSASISTLLSALAGSRLWFLSFSVSSPSLSPSVFFPPFWRNLLVFHSACLFSRSFCPPFPYSSTLRERRALRRLSGGK